jgi:hypothetical protein
MHTEKKLGNRSDPSHGPPMNGLASSTSSAYPNTACGAMRVLSAFSAWAARQVRGALLRRLATMVGDS